MEVYEIICKNLSTAIRYLVKFLHLGTNTSIMMFCGKYNYARFYQKILIFDFRVSNFSSSDEKMCGTIGQSQNEPNLPKSLSVEETFDPWFRQQGYPFLRVSRDGDRKMVFI